MKARTGCSPLSAFTAFIIALPFSGSTSPDRTHALVYSYLSQIGKKYCTNFKVGRLYSKWYLLLMDVYCVYYTMIVRLWHVSKRKTYTCSLKSLVNNHFLDNMYNFVIVLLFVFIVSFNVSYCLNVKAILRVW